MDGTHGVALEEKTSKTEQKRRRKKRREDNVAHYNFTGGKKYRRFMIDSIVRPLIVKEH